MQVSSLKALAALVVAGFVVLSFGKQIHAQESPQRQMNISDDQLRAFAKVYVAIDKIRQTYEPRLNKAQDPEEGKQIRSEATSKMQEAVTEGGLTEESYKQIFEIAQADEGVRTKLLNLINEEKQKS